MSKYGPSRKELKLRMIVSAGGLLLLTVALALRGLPKGPAMFEVIGIAGVFFGGTFLWSLKNLLRRDHPDAS
ncbi:hypothetical protein So717_14870 [Roseobacter cerasinus]|uniref:Uncharacterized protein n=1 Tax=Roseobacter cerasinus TaxID=2602289 RepID=A0A640VQ45_9RHOB|nr:hypothetical protein [Roseobacter cerasinus]GFE49734.1 hypothetical protein So717_14870 [Roseobacter cerasinus]